MKDLGLIVLKNAEDLGDRVDNNLKEMNDSKYSFKIPIEETRFSNGEGKIKILESIREKDIYILSDIGNYDVSYQLHGRTHFVAPDEHFNDIKRVISATANHADRVSLIMPLLYESRQDKRKGRESLDCALALQELVSLGIKNIITFDAHNPAVQNAIPTMSFENIYPTNSMLTTLFENENLINPDEKILVLSPDFGAIERARYYAEMIGSDVGAFYKRRDYSKIIDGKNPIVEHSYLGPEIKDKNVIIVDDMIASGGSILDVSKEAKMRGAKSIFICASFALFTEGIEKIDEMYEKGFFDYIYSTNLSYIPEYIRNKDWFCSVDCSELIARIIYNLNNGKSLEPIHNGKIETYKTLSLKKKR